MSTTPRELQYRGWRISYEPWNSCPGEPWVYVSDGYDGLGDTRHGTAKTIRDAIDAIDWEIDLPRALAKRLSPKQIRRLVASLDAQLQRRGMFDLVQDVADAILEAEGPQDAAASTFRLIEAAKHVCCARWRRGTEGN